MDNFTTYQYILNNGLTETIEGVLKNGLTETIEAENIYEAIEQIVRVKGVHPSKIIGIKKLFL